jgi:hypothetical protein
MTFAPARAALAAALVALPPAAAAEDPAVQETAAEWRTAAAPEVETPAAAAAAEPAVSSASSQEAQEPEASGESAREETEIERLLNPEGLLSRDLDVQGHIVVRRLGPGGTILERTVDASGRMLAERVAGSCADLPLVAETQGEGLDPVRTVQDPSGALLRFAMRDGRVAGDAEMVEPPSGL